MGFKKKLREANEWMEDLCVDGVFAGTGPTVAPKALVEMHKAAKTDSGGGRDDYVLPSSVEQLVGADTLKFAGRLQLDAIVNEE